MVVETPKDEETYDVFENWAKKGDFPNQPVPHPCDRVCRKGQSMICRYTFVLELHTSMGKVRFVEHVSLLFSVFSNNFLNYSINNSSCFDSYQQILAML